MFDAKKILRYMKESNHSIASFSERLRIDVDALQTILNGSVDFDLMAALKISRAMGVPIQSLITERRKKIALVRKIS